MTNKKILVSVVNYCDPEFYSTVKSLWDNAKYKDRLIFSLISEDTEVYDFSFIPLNQRRYSHYDLSRYRGGLGWARNLATKVEDDYDFFIQFDSHTYASYGWDDLAIKRYNNILLTEKEKFIICYAPANYEILENGDIDFNIDNKVSMYAKDYLNVIPGFNFPGYQTLNEEEIVRSYWATCCYLFAPKRWVEEVGISKDESFNTEEISLSIRTFANEWKIFSIGTRDVFHHTSHKQQNGIVTRQIFRPWADNRKNDYWNHVEIATNRLSKLMSGQLDVSIQKVTDFFLKVGISPKYLSYIDNYSSHVIIEDRPLGMPPRRD
jgi:hypothetical protein